MRTRLCDISVGECALVSEVKSTCGLRRRLRELGLVEGTAVECLGESPAGDPRAYYVRGTVLALRRRDAEGVLVEARAARESEKWE